MSSSTSAQSTAELNLICLTLKTFLKTASAETVAQHLANHPPDPSQLLQRLQKHRLTSVVYLTLKQSELLSALPPTLQAQLASQHQRLIHRSLQLTTETIKLIQQFQQADIRVLPLKGILLSQQLYGSFIHRAPGDIDLLLEPNTYQYAVVLLESLGYRWSFADESLSATQQKLYVQQRGEVTYKNPSTNISVDLHIRWSSNRYLFPLPFDEAWHQAIQLPIGTDSQIPVLCLSHQLLYLTAHGAKHRWDRLSWLLDIAQLLQFSDALDVELIQTVAPALGIQRPIQQMLQLIQQWLSCEPPGVLYQPQYQPAVVQQLVRIASQQILDKQSPPTAEQLFKINAITPQALWPPLQYQFSLKPGIAYRQACLTSMLFSIRDWQMLPLPEPLWFLYIVLRPFLYVWRLQR